MDLRGLPAALDVLATPAPGAMQLHHVQIVCHLAAYGSSGCTYAEIEERFGLSNASVSRCMNALSDSARHRESALGLVEIFRDPREGRRYRCRLSKQGQALMRSVAAIMNEGATTAAKAA